MIDLNKLIIKDLIVDEDVILKDKPLINGLKEVKNAHYSGTIKLNADEQNRRAAYQAKQAEEAAAAAAAQAAQENPAPTE